MRLDYSAQPTGAANADVSRDTAPDQKRDRAFGSASFVSQRTDARGTRAISEQSG